MSQEKSNNDILQTSIYRVEMPYSFYLVVAYAREHARSIVMCEELKLQFADKKLKLKFIEEVKDAEVNLIGKYDDMLPEEWDAISDGDDYYIYTEDGIRGVPFHEIARWHSGPQIIGYKEFFKRGDDE